MTKENSYVWVISYEKFDEIYSDWMCRFIRFRDDYIGKKNIKFRLKNDVNLIVYSPFMAMLFSHEKVKLRERDLGPPIEVDVHKTFGPVYHKAFIEGYNEIIDEANYFNDVLLFNSVIEKREIAVNKGWRFIQTEFSTVLNLDKTPQKNADSLLVLIDNDKLSKIADAAGKIYAASYLKELKLSEARKIKDLFEKELVGLNVNN